MSVSMKNLDPAFHGVGQKAGMEIWRIQNFAPVLVPKADHGKFYTGDSYIILRTTALKSGALRHDLHFWLGKATSQDEAGTAAIKSVELDAALGGRAVQYREVQGFETEKFLTYFRPCIIPLEGGFASGFKKPEVAAYDPRLFICKGRREVRVKQVPFARSSLNHDDVFILDTESKIYQFNGVTSSIQERAKALEVVQYIKDNDHGGKCAVAIIEDGKMAAEADTGEFWGLFGGFAPIGKKGTTKDDAPMGSDDGKLFSVVDEHLKEIAAAPLKRELLDTDKWFLLDSGLVVYVWTGRNTSLEARKGATKAAESYVGDNKPASTHIIRVIEGFETLTFKACFETWDSGAGSVVSEEGRGKVAALLKQQGINVNGLLKASAANEDKPPLLDSTGKLEVWMVDGKSKSVVAPEQLGKFHSGDCYIVLYTCQGDQREIDYFLAYWTGKQSTEEAQSSAIQQTKAMSSSVKGRVVQARIFEEKEPPQFKALFNSMVIFKGGLSSGYKQLLGETGSEDESYSEEALSLFRVRGTKPYNSQAVQVEPVSTSLNSADCFILQAPKTYLLWFGSFSTLEEQQVALQMATFIKPESSPKALKEGSEPASFWNAIGGKKVYPSQRDPVNAEKDPRLFVYNPKAGNALLAEEIYNFTQDDLLSDDVMLFDTQNEVFVWLGQNVSSKDKQDAFLIAERYVERASTLDGLPKDTAIYKVSEGSEPAFFTRYFSWDAAKSAVHVDPFERRLAALQGRAAQTLDTPTPPKRRTSAGAQETTPGQKSERPAVSPRASVKKSTLSSVFPSPRPSIETESKDNGSSTLQAEAETTLPVEAPAAATAKGDGTFSYESLKVRSSNPAAGIDITRRETYLSPEEFEKVFGMDIEGFNALPKWKRDQKKKAADLF